MITTLRFWLAGKLLNWGIDMIPNETVRDYMGYKLSEAGRELEEALEEAR